MQRSVPVLVLLFSLSACATGEIGSLQVCSEGIDTSSGDSVDLELTGTLVTAEGCLDESQAFTVDDGEGGLSSFGVTVLDAAGEDITPTLALEEGAAVDLLFRYRLVWGAASGLVLSDEQGVVIAAQQGWWGGALQEGDIEGLEGLSLTALAIAAYEWVPSNTCSISDVSDDSGTWLLARP